MTPEQAVRLLDLGSRMRRWQRKCIATNSFTDMRKRQKAEDQFDAMLLECEGTLPQGTLFPTSNSKGETHG